MTRRTGYALGAYGVYPALTAAGALLLSREESAGGLAAAALLLCAALVLPWFLGRSCRRCGERLLPRLLTLLLLPAAVTAALAFRSAFGAGQWIAFALLGLSAVVFSLAWRLSAEAAPATGEKRPAPAER